MGTMLSYFVIYSITDDKKLNKKLQKSYKAFTIFTIYSTIFYIQKSINIIRKKKVSKRGFVCKSNEKKSMQSMQSCKPRS